MLSVRQLRALDIQERDEEDLVQEVLNAKLAKERPEISVKVPFVDIVTKEQETKQQELIDELEGRGKKAPGEELPQEPTPDEGDESPKKVEAPKRRGRKPKTE